MVTVALAPARSGRFGSGGVAILIRTGKRWVTLTQFPVAFSGGRTENGARAGAVALDRAVKRHARVHVDLDGRLLPGPDAAEIGLFEVGVDPPISILDQSEGRRAGLYDRAGAYADIRHPPVSRRSDVGLHAIMGGFVELGRGPPELGGGRRHGELGVLRLGEFAFGVVE